MSGRQKINSIKIILIDTHYSNDGRKQWTMINNLLNRKPKAKININKLHNGNETLTNAQDIADSFNNFFCNITQNLRTKVCAIQIDLPKIHF